MGFEEQIMSKVKISEHIVKSNIFRSTGSLENWGISLGYSPVYLGHIQSCDAFRPITCEQNI